MSFYNTLMNPRAESLHCGGDSAKRAANSRSSGEKSGKFLEMLFSRLDDESGQAISFDDLSRDMEISSPEYLEENNSHTSEFKSDEKFNVVRKNEHSRNERDNSVKFEEDKNSDRPEEIKAFKEKVKELEEKENIEAEDLKELRKLAEKAADKDKKDIEPETLKLFQDVFEKLFNLEELLKGKDLKEAQKMLDEVEKMLGMFQKQVKGLEKKIEKLFEGKFKGLLEELGVSDKKIEEMLESDEDSNFSQEISGILKSLKELKKALEKIEETAGDDVDIEKLLGGESKGKEAKKLAKMLEEFQQQKEDFEKFLQDGKNKGQENNKETSLIKKMFQEELAELKEMLEKVDIEELDITEEELREKLEKLQDGKKSEGQEKTKSSGENSQNKEKAKKEEASRQETEQNKEDKKVKAGKKETAADKNEAAKKEKNSEKTSESEKKSEGVGEKNRDRKISAEERGRKRTAGENVQRGKNTENKSASPGRNKGETGRAAEQVSADAVARADGKTVSVEQIVEMFGEKLEIEIGNETEKVAQAGEKGSDEQLEGKKLLQSETDEKSALKQQNKKMAGYELNSARSGGQNSKGENGFNSSQNHNSNQFQQQTAESGEVQQSYISKEKMMETQKLIDQITEKSKMMLEKGKQTMRIQLEPEMLGELKMEIQVEGNELSASFYAEKSQVKESLDKNMKQLQEALEQLNIDVNELDVEALDDQTGGRTEDWFEEERPGEDTPSQAGENGREEETNESSGQSRAARVNLLENSTMELIA